MQCEISPKIAGLPSSLPNNNCITVVFVKEERAADKRSTPYSTHILSTKQSGGLPSYVGHAGTVLYMGDRNVISSYHIYVSCFSTMMWASSEKCSLLWHHFLIPRLHDTTGCQTCCTTGFTTGWMFVYTMQPVVQPAVGCTMTVVELQPVVQPVVFDNRLHRVNGALVTQLNSTSCNGRRCEHLFVRISITLIYI